MLIGKLSYFRQGSIQVVIAYALSPELSLDKIVEANKKLLEVLPDQTLTLGSTTYDTVAEPAVLSAYSDIADGTEVVGEIMDICLLRFTITTLHYIFCVSSHTGHVPSTS